MSYLLDSDVMMEARKHSYRFDIYPGFWECPILAREILDSIPKRELEPAPE